MTAPTPNNRAETETFLERAGLRFVVVRFYLADRDHQPWVEERHVDDPVTLEHVVRQTLSRHRARYAVCPYHGRWALICSARLTRYYDTREAAEMVAIHNG